MININPILSSLIVKSDSKEKAITIGNKSHTYKDIYDDSRRLATYLSAIGIKKGDTALIATPTSYQFLLIFYASILLKVKIGIIDPEIDHEAYLAKINQLNPQWAFVDRKLLFIHEHALLKKMYPNNGINHIDFSNIDQIKTIATGAWRPLMRSYENFDQYRIHPPYDIDPSFVDYEYIISYTSTDMRKVSSTVHTLGTISYNINFISRMVNDVEEKSFTTHLPHMMIIGVSAGLKLKLWNDRWTIDKKINFLEAKQISVLSIAPIVFDKMIEYCIDNYRKLPNCLEQIIIDSSIENSIDIKKIEKFIHKTTKVTVMYSKADHLYEVY